MGTIWTTACIVVTESFKSPALMGKNTTDHELFPPLLIPEEKISAFKSLTCIKNAWRKISGYRLDKDMEFTNQRNINLSGITGGLVERYEPDMRSKNPFTKKSSLRTKQGHIALFCQPDRKVLRRCRED